MIKFRALSKIFTSFLLVISLVLPFFYLPVYAEFNVSVISEGNIYSYVWWSAFGVNRINKWQDMNGLSLATTPSTITLNTHYTGTIQLQDLGENLRCEPVPGNTNGAFSCYVNQNWSNIHIDGYDADVNSSTTGKVQMFFDGSLFDQTNAQPIQIYPYLSGTYTPRSGFGYDQSIFIPAGNKYYISFVSNTYTGSVTLRYDTGSGNVTYTNVSSVKAGNGVIPQYKYTYTFTNNDTKPANVQIIFNGFIGKNVNIIPLYMGNLWDATDEDRQRMMLDTDTELLLRELVGLDKIRNTYLDSANSNINRGNDLIQNGDSGTTSTVNTNSNTTSQFNSAKDSYIGQENSFLNDFSSRVASLPKTASIINLSAFRSSMLFVSNTFTRLISNTPFEYLLSFSLILGISLIFIGKMRR